MRAIVQHGYGPPPDVLALREVDPPTVTEDTVLVRVRASSANPLDYHGVTGTPYIARMANGFRAPREARPGVDLAGEVEAVGANVDGFSPGDEVFGAGAGAFAEYVSLSPDKIVAKPAGLTFEEAAAVPVAAVTALQGVRDKAGVRAGHKVLVNGASGGVGTFAVQIAKAFGAEVTGVCSTRNVELVASLGADRVIDYTREDFVHSGQRYDVIIDIAGGRSIADRRRVLERDGILVVLGAPKTNRLVGPLGGFLSVIVARPFVRPRMVAMLAATRPEDLTALADLLAAGTVRPVVERTYQLAETPQALAYLGQGHARGKLVITI